MESVVEGTPLRERLRGLIKAGTEKDTRESGAYMNMDSWKTTETSRDEEVVVTLEELTSLV